MHLLIVHVHDPTLAYTYIDCSTCVLNEEIDWTEQEKSRGLKIRFKIRLKPRLRFDEVQLESDRFTSTIVRPIDRIRYS